MSVMAMAWVAIALTSLLLVLRRSAYAVGFYMLTFFAAPHLWWWGKDLPSLRYAVIAGLVMLGAVLFHMNRSSQEREFSFTIVHKAAIGMALNATFVHFFLASVPSVSVDNYVEFLKYILLFFLMCRAMEGRADLRVVIMSIALGAAYIGYEVTINERGYFSGSRLEGVGAPAADSSNSLASVMLLTLPLIGSLWIKGAKRHKLVAILAAPLVLNVVLLCNSRGAFLALIGAGVSFLLVARGATRKQAIRTLALAAVALYLLLGDPKILDRFATTFAGSESRDRSAASRLEFWKAGLLMIADYPLGDGGGSFKYVRGGQYLKLVIGDDQDRSLHNGFLTEATEWGIQGLLLRLIFVGGALAAAYRTTNRCRQEGRTEDALLGICLIVSLAGFLITCVFGSFLRNEWGYWIVALLVRYGEVYRVAEIAPVPRYCPSVPSPMVLPGQLSSAGVTR
jgi:putative inorganic carbon (hco3(-)) transporter